MFKCNYNMKMDRCSIITIKLAVIAFVFIVLKMFNGVANWVFNTNIWWFVGTFVILMVKLGLTCGCSNSKPKVKKAKIKTKK